MSPRCCIVVVGLLLVGAHASELVFKSPDAEATITWDGTTLNVPQHCREDACSANSAAIEKLRADLDRLADRVALIENPPTTTTTTAPGQLFTWPKLNSIDICCKRGGTDTYQLAQKFCSAQGYKAVEDVVEEPNLGGACTYDQGSGLSRDGNHGCHVKSVMCATSSRSGTKRFALPELSGNPICCSRSGTDSQLLARKFCNDRGFAAAGPISTQVSSGACTYGSPSDLRRDGNHGCHVQSVACGATAPSVKKFDNPQHQGEPICCARGGDITDSNLAMGWCQQKGFAGVAATSQLTRGGACWGNWHDGSVGDWGRDGNHGCHFASITCSYE